MKKKKKISIDQGQRNYDNTTKILLNYLNMFAKIAFAKNKNNKNNLIKEAFIKRLKLLRYLNYFVSFL